MESNQQGPDLELTYVAAAITPPPTLPELARRVLQACDGRRSGSEICCSIGVPVGQQSALFQKLLCLGLLEPAFSPEEEAFFAAELEPDAWEAPPPRRVRNTIEHLLAVGKKAVGRG